MSKGYLHLLLIVFHYLKDEKKSCFGKYQKYFIHAICVLLEKSPHIMCQQESLVCVHILYTVFSATTMACQFPCLTAPSRLRHDMGNNDKVNSFTKNRQATFVNSGSED